jgi:hypothetical protein
LIECPGLPEIIPPPDAGDGLAIYGGRDDHRAARTGVAGDGDRTRIRGIYRVDEITGLHRSGQHQQQQQRGAGGS